MQFETSMRFFLVSAKHIRLTSSGYRFYFSKNLEAVSSLPEPV
jgi:hypothetical protein